jgi:hypothetical protein
MNDVVVALAKIEVKKSRLICVAMILLTLCSLPSLSFGSIKSTSGNLNFYINEESLKMSLTETGLGVSNDNPSQALDVQGNVVVSNSFSVGSTSVGSSNLTVNGSIAFSVLNVSSNITLADSSVILVDTSSGNVALNFVNAGPNIYHSPVEKFTIKTIRIKSS